MLYNALYICMPIELRSILFTANIFFQIELCMPYSYKSTGTCTGREVH